MEDRTGDSMMAGNRLILSPSQAEAQPGSPEAVIDALTEIGFLGPALTGSNPADYLVGQRFLQLVTFLGCSPHIELAPPAKGSRAFCHLSISGPFERVHFISGANTRAPACPSCGAREPNWKLLVDDWRRHPEHDRWTCSGCGETSSASGLDWRQSAGFGRFFVEIHEVFPGEAVPVDELMETLSQSTDAPWSYFYVSNPVDQEAVS